MATNQTSNYQLNQWEPTDKVLRTDFNDDNIKIDEALKSLSSKDLALESLMSKCGNCRIYYTSYVGNGTYGASNLNTIVFPNKPLLVLIGDQGDDGRVLYALTGMKKTYAHSSGYSLISLNWSGNTLSWSHHMSAEGQLNRAGITYSVIALLEAGE